MDRAKIYSYKFFFFFFFFNKCCKKEGSGTHRLKKACLKLGQAEGNLMVVLVIPVGKKLPLSSMLYAFSFAYIPQITYVNSFLSASVSEAIAYIFNRVRFLVTFHISYQSSNLLIF